jgi:fructosamine-3-kinase
MLLWTELGNRISAVTGKPFVKQAQESVTGGSINTAYKLQGTDQRYFVKLNKAAYLAMFEAEMAGILELAASKTVRVPHPICCGTLGDQAYLVLEFLDLQSVDENVMALLGQQLACLHKTVHSAFGWYRNNTIGTTPQINSIHTDWGCFWRQHRLKPQLDLAASNGYGGKLQRNGERLLACVKTLFDNYCPTPALLHGDLWRGNASCDHYGQPVIFDPAVYYGDRETDLAMTELFGGFSPRFYDAYHESYPLPSDYPIRRQLYQLYHVLNHLNLFGSSYLQQAEGIIDSLLAEIG